MRIRKTRPDEIELLLQMYADARRCMAENGNPTQWGATRPSAGTVTRDVQEGGSYVCEHNGRVAAAFCFLIGEDPTYLEIWDGAWLESGPYGVVHRLVSNGSARGAAAACLDWALAQCRSLRIDTHENNAPMRALLKKCDFHYCGRIRASDGTDRLAFQKCLPPGGAKTEDIQAIRNMD